MAPDSSAPLLLVQHHHSFFQMFMHWVSFGVHMFMIYCTAYFVYHKYMKPYEEGKSGKRAGEHGNSGGFQ